MNRRNFLMALGAGTLSAGCAPYWPDEGFWNPCLDGSLPDKLLKHELVQAAWEGLDAAQVWDCHVHLIGLGDDASGVWVNPEMRSWWHPIKYTQFKFYLNASCTQENNHADRTYVDRLVALHQGYVATLERGNEGIERGKEGTRLMLLAFDHHYDELGRRQMQSSAFYTPNEYASRIVKQYPRQFEWIASIHPYRSDCVSALEQAVKGGARAIKWLPSAMGIDPASPLCDRLYEAMVRFNIPLLTHAGTELAVHGEEAQRLGNPLLLRRPLEHGVRVIVAHCASLGSSTDIDKGPDGPQVDNFDLFARMMDESRYQRLLYGDISAMTQVNRVGLPLDMVIRRSQWHHRLINGSDYPLPGVMPLFSMQQLVERGYLQAGEAEVLSAIRRYNALLFDFVLKRCLRLNGARFSNEVFETKRVFVESGVAKS